MQLSRLLLLCLFEFFLFASVTAPSQWDVRDVDGIQIYMNNNNWYSIKEGINFKEAGPLCDALSSSYSMVNYTNTIDADNEALVALTCQDNQIISSCTANIESGQSKKIGLECMSSAGLQPGTLRQLDDGRILYLYKPSKINFLAWAHICYDDNDDWDTHAADLFCKELGFENVKSNQFKDEFQDKVDAFGLMDFNCDQATQFSECTFNPIGGNGRCSNDVVFTIQCENPITTTPTTTPTTMSTTTPTTMSTTTPTTTPSTTPTTMPTTTPTTMTTTTPTTMSTTTPTTTPSTTPTTTPTTMTTTTPTTIPTPTSTVSATDGYSHYNGPPPSTSEGIANPQVGLLYIFFKYLPDVLGISEVGIQEQIQ